MCAFRLTPVVIFVLGIAALVASPHIASAQGADTPRPPDAVKAPQTQIQSPTPAKKPTPSAAARASVATATASSTPGCAWIGKRVIHSLLRDDAVTAQDFDRLYHAFSCAGDQLRAAFDCTVAAGALPTAAEAQTRVDNCWADPKFDTKATKMAPTAAPAPTKNAPAAPAATQPKSAPSKAVVPAPVMGSTPNYPQPKPR